MVNAINKKGSLNLKKGYASLVITILMVVAHFIDTLLLDNQAVANSFISFPVSLKSGTALLLVFLFGSQACLSIFASLLAASVSVSLIQSHDPMYIFTAINCAFISIQSYVIFGSFKSSVKKANPLESSRTLIFYISICVLITGSINLLLAIVSNSFHPEELFTKDLIITNFLINQTSLLILPCLFFAYQNHTHRIPQNTHPLEWFIWFSSTIFAAYFASQSHYSFMLLSLPLLMWVSSRFNQLTCTFSLVLSTGLLIFELSSSAYTVHFPNIPSYSFHAIWLILVITTLYFSALRADRRRLEARLEDLVDQRTLALSTANQELRDEVYIREQAEHLLRSSSQKFKALFETAGIPIIVLDESFKIKQWNTAAELQFAFTRDAAIGNDFIEMFIPESSQDETAWKFTKVLESGMNKENLESIITSQDGLSHTMLWNMSNFSDQSDPNHKSQLLLIGQNISEIRKTQNQLHYLAHFDALTDTANRRLFEDRCDQAIQSSIRHKHEIALIGLDIDHFKRINDNFGHDIGDQFLVVLAQRLKDSVRKEDTVARLGGDEFAILLASITGREGAERVARNILENITQPVVINGNELLVTSSIGITLCPNDATKYPDLLKNADMAMYRAKNSGRNNIQFYSPEMNNEMKRQLEVEQELRAALLENQFCLYYQPIIDIETGEVLALEALLRWEHPTKGLIQPSYFLDIAEQSGQLQEIGQWVIKNACTQGHAIHEWAQSQIQLALNLSSRQFNHPSLVETVSRITQETKFNPRNLILEMSENTITTDMEASFKTLSSLSDLGVSLTIDSFGTGLSSLRQLKQIPIDIIKIDKTFVSGIPNDESDMAITETLLAVANQMDLKTFATGVETAEQEAFLKINGCRYAQGFLYAAPIPFSQLPELFDKIHSGQNLSQGEQIFLPFENALAAN